MPEISDHDAIVTLVAEVKQLREDIKDLKDTTSQKVVDHETRLRRLELIGGIAVGLSYALQFYLSFLKDK